MHQREASIYGRPFFYGRKRLSLTQVQEVLKAEPSIGFVPPEFDDIDGGEREMKDDLRAERYLPR